MYAPGKGPRRPKAVSRGANGTVGGSRPKAMKKANTRKRATKTESLKRQAKARGYRGGFKG